MKTSEPPKVYTVAETAAQLRVHPETVYDAIKRGDIRAIRLGKKILVPAAELDRLLLVG